MEASPEPVKKLDTRKSIERASIHKALKTGWCMKVASREFIWANQMERVNLIRVGLPFESIEAIGNKANLPVKQVLSKLGIAQTTYNKKKREKERMSGRDSEVILMLFELLEYGLEVFNNESDKFQRWLQKPNISLGAVKPESLFDSVTGILEVKNALNRLEYGQFA